MPKQITSLQNPLIKQFMLLKEKSRERKKAGLFLIEGLREIELAIAGGYTLHYVLYLPEIIGIETLNTLPLQAVEHIEVSKPIYEKLAYRDTTEGIIAIAKIKTISLNQLKFTTTTPLVLVAEAPEKPGNIGALLRTANAAKLDAVIIANPKTDLYNPNIIRSSLGCVFTTAVATGTTHDIINYLKAQHIAIYCAALQASKVYTTQDFKIPSAIVVGTEATGLSNQWLEHATQNIIIPMQGEIDSINVSVAAGIIIFEAKRQRNFK